MSLGKQSVIVKCIEFGFRLDSKCLCGSLVDLNMHVMQSALMAKDEIIPVSVNYSYHRVSSGNSPTMP